MQRGLKEIALQGTILNRGKSNIAIAIGNGGGSKNIFADRSNVALK